MKLPGCAVFAPEFEIIQYILFVIFSSDFFDYLYFFQATFENPHKKEAISDLLADCDILL